MVGSKYTVRYGITLVEVVVVIIVLGMLAALLMLALMPTCKLPESGRRSVCNSSLRQLALATLNFESKHNRFPGYLEQPIPENDREIPWLVTLMPFIERNDIHEAWMNGESPPPKNYLKILRCQSDPPENVNDDHNSYACNAGLIITNSNGPNVIYEDDNLPANGIFIDLRKNLDNSKFMRANKIYDGQSNTMLLSENLLAGGWGDVSPVVAAGTPESKVKLTTTFCWLNTKTPTTDMRINGNFRTARKLTPELLRPSSNHHHGANAAFADGHTQFLRDNIDYRVYKQLMTPKSKESSNSEKDYMLKDEDYE